MSWQEHIEAGELTDLPGHCKWCGKPAPDDAHLMHDPRGLGEPIAFCSAACLHKAEHIFDGVSADKLAELERAVSAAEAETAVLS